MAHSPRMKIHARQGSPVVKEASDIVSNFTTSRSSYTWAAVCFVVAVLLFYEFYFHLMRPLMSLEVDQYPLVHYSIFALAILFALSSALDLLRALQTSFATPSFVLSPLQKKLMGLKMPDKNGSYRPNRSVGDCGEIVQNKFNLSDLTMHGQQFSLSAHDISAGNLSASPSPSNSFHCTISTPVLHQGGSFNSSSILQSHPRIKTSPIHRVSFDTSVVDSSGNNSPSLRRRSSYYNSPLPVEDYMTQQSALKNYLDEFEREQTKFQAYDTSFGYGTNWNFSTFHDYSNELMESIYQLSTLSPKSATRTDNKDDTARLKVEEYWLQSGVSMEGVTRSVSRLRRWISLVVLRSFVKEVDKINRRLDELGCSDVQIGKSSVATLKQVQSGKLQQIPTLTWILFYLELSTNQEYLVERIRVLATGGYLSEFVWNKGGKFKGREWSDDLPNDCDVIMHAFGVYIDQHYPLHPRYPDGRTFFTRNYRQTPDKLGDNDKLVIHRSKLNPPHYQVASDGVVYDPPPGRHNLFHAVVLFIHLIKSKDNAMLGPVSLDKSGLDILHVIS